MFTILRILCFLLIRHLFTCSDGMKICSRDYCNDNYQNTLCFQSENPARHCIEYERTIHTEKDKQAILDKLNRRRNKVAAGEINSLPSANNMMKLQWNSELEMSAQRWANQCVKHSVPDIKDTCRDLGTGGELHDEHGTGGELHDEHDKTYIGQNIATIVGYSPGLTPLALVDVWYMELLNINASVLGQFLPSAETGFPHYDYFTQLVWAASTQVGCGGVKFKERVGEPMLEGNRTIYRLVCNFAPAGNRRDRNVYTEGLPCSRCENGYCDSVYKALCVSESLVSTQKPIDAEPILSEDFIANITEVTKVLVSAPLEERETLPITAPIEDDYTPFDYFSHLHQLTTRTLSTTTSPVSCKDSLAVDDLVELLKKKLSTDPMFKEIMQTTKMPFQNDGGYTDASVAALVSRIYSKKLPPTTTKSTASEFVNSTLLVDLVEAVIFRQNDKIRNSVGGDVKPESSYDVSPLRIKAELPEIRQNADFTGHYFFPEDDVNVEESSSETTEIYYDSSNPPVSEIVFEIEEFKRNKVTNDFIDEILESETGTESTTFKMLSPDDINLYKSGKNSMKKFLEEIAEKNHKTRVPEV